MSHLLFSHPLSLSLNAPLISLPLFRSLSLVEAHTQSSPPKETKHRESTPFAEPYKESQRVQRSSWALQRGQILHKINKKCGWNRQNPLTGTPQRQGLREIFRTSLGIWGGRNTSWEPKTEPGAISLSQFLSVWKTNRGKRGFRWDEKSGREVCVGTSAREKWKKISTERLESNTWRK